MPYEEDTCHKDQRLTSYPEPQIWDNVVVHCHASGVINYDYILYYYHHTYAGHGLLQPVTCACMNVHDSIEVMYEKV